MNSDRDDLKRLIQHVTSLLHSQHIRERFDDPVDRAASEFGASALLSQPRRSREFLQVLGEFVMHLYRQVPVLAQELSPSQAQQEVVGLLEDAYSGCNGNGYEDAFRHALDYGYAAACSVITEAMKARYRREYIHWVLLTHIEYLDSQTKIDLISCLLENWNGTPPESLGHCSIREMAPKCATLVLLQAQCLEDLDRMLGVTPHSAAYHG